MTYFGIPFSKVLRGLAWTGLILFVLGLSAVYTPSGSSKKGDGVMSLDSKQRDRSGLEDSPYWQKKLVEDLPLLGHRNWIVIADSAYPWQSSPGIETLYTGADHLEVLRIVLSALEHSRHIKPVVYLDAEMKYVPEESAPGIQAYRAKLNQLLGQRMVNTLPHEEIIARLNEAGKTFRILVLKTNLTIPYTSVFLQLDCAYWSPDAERKLRETMQKG